MSSSTTIKPMRLLLMAIGSVGKDDATTTYCYHHFARIDPEATKEKKETKFIVEEKKVANEEKEVVGEKGNAVEKTAAEEEDALDDEATIGAEAFMSENISAPPGAYKMLAEEFIREADAVLIVYSVRSRSAFKRVKHEYAHIERVRSEIHPSRRFWHRYRVPPMPIILAGNIAEMGDSREVSTEEGSKLGSELGVEFMEIAVADRSPVEALFYELVQTIQTYKMLAQLGNQPSLKPQPITLLSLGTALRSWTTSLMDALREAMKPRQRKPDEEYSLTEAISADELDIARRLLLRGVDPNIPDEQGFYPLHLASARDQLDTVHLLLEKGALVDQVAPLNGTALSIAAVRGHNEIVKALLDNGASLDTPCDYYGNVLQAVTRRNHPSIKKRFELPIDRR